MKILLSNSNNKGFNLPFQQAINGNFKLSDGNYYNDNQKIGLNNTVIKDLSKDNISGYFGNGNCLVNVTFAMRYYDYDTRDLDGNATDNFYNATSEYSTEQSNFGEWVLTDDYEFLNYLIVNINKINNEYIVNCSLTDEGKDLISEGRIIGLFILYYDKDIDSVVPINTYFNILEE